ncbi:MAG: winged helix-turn-helix domain-containing protein [Myxococcales bacterium]|nr:winged helix-turn-helix domain-containing protein [Myxococcales bacterium]
MIDYLIPSTTRRRLLTALYVEGHTGTVSSLARRAGVSAASAHVELHGMELAGLARRSLESGRHHFGAASEHAVADALRTLLEYQPSSASTRRGRRGDNSAATRTRNDLAAHGAPLRGHRASAKASASLEETLARGVVLSREDPEVARHMPALFIRHEASIDYPALTAALHELRHKHSAGFLMALAADLTKDRRVGTRLRSRARALRDNRRKKVVDFFSPRANPTPAADTHTMKTALKWKFHFPWPLAEFPT